MSVLDDYIYAAALCEISGNQSGINQTYLSRDSMAEQMSAILRAEGITPAQVETCISKMASDDTLSVIEDGLAGNFYRINIPMIVQRLGESANDPTSLIFKYRAVGRQFLYNAMRAATDPEKRLDAEYDSTRRVPAADRIVSLSHNQSSEYEEKTDEIIQAVESLNSIDGPVGLREIIIGQLKAGRELIRAGSFKLFVMQCTLIEALSFLAKRYEREVIGALASSLMAALLAHIGIEA